MKRHHKSHEDEVEPRYLPHDLITRHILTRLPIKPLIRFKSVSKQWYSTISSHQFAHTHFKSPHPSSPTESLIIQSSNDKFQFLSYTDDENYQIAQLLEVDFDAGDEMLVLVGSCNGLVCLGSTSGQLFIIWNPVTREFHKYSDSEIYDDYTKEGMSTTWGFGYVSAIDDYKIVRILKKTFHPLYRIHVFSIKLNKWRRIDEETGHDFTYLQMGDQSCRPGMLVHQTLYWMGGLRSVHHGLERKILSFNLELELLETFPHPDVSSAFAGTIYTETGDDRLLFVLNGCVCKFGCLVFGGGVITVLKQTGETEKLCTPNMSLNGWGIDNLIGFTSSYKIFKLHGADLAIVDLSSRPVKLTPLRTFEGTSEIRIFSYSPTLISPNCITTTTKATI